MKVPTRARQLIFRICVLSFVFSTPLLLLPAAVFCQDSSSRQAARNTSTQQADSAHPDQSSAELRSQLARESREATGEEKDENEEFRKSPAISFVARITGMSLQDAYWLCMALNFAIVAGAVIWFSRSRLPGFFRKRTLSIQKAIEEARKASQEANRRLADIEARLSKLDLEISEMGAAAERAAIAEEARIKAAAQDDTRKIIEAAEQEIAAATQAARRELKAYAADLAVSLARQQIRVDNSTDQALVRSFARQLAVADPNSATPGKDGR